jgi:hypothetical protein
MALNDASTTRTNTASKTPSATLNGAVGDAIGVIVDTAAAAGRTKTSTFDLEAVINGRTTPVEIVQSGENLDLGDVCAALAEKGYRVSFRPKKAHSETGKSRVTFTIAWDSV